MKKIRQLVELVLMTAIVLFALGPVAQAAYQFNKKVTVDHTRVYGIPSGYGYMKKITIDKDRIGGTTTAPPSGFSGLKKMTINSAKVSGSSDLANFPVLVNIGSDPNLKTTSEGGQVTDDQGSDIIFYDETLTTQLDHEVEIYEGTTGRLVAWVRIPALKATQDTVFYLAYGNSGIGTSQENPTGVWDSNFQVVHHIDATPGTTTDSTQYNRDAINESSMDYRSTGKIGDALLFDESGSYYEISDFDYGDTLTLSMWVKVTDNVGSGYQYIYSHDENETHPSLNVNIREDSSPYSNPDTLDVNLRDNGSNIEDLESNVPAGDINVADGNWHYVTVTRVRNGTNNVYVDGVSQDTSSGANTAIDPAGRINIGRRQDGDSDRYFGGYLDEIRISNTERSADWIKTQYNNQNSPGSFLTIEESGGLENFPVLVSLTSNDLKSPGRVTSASGHDMIFMDGTLSGQLDHEVESYDPATGTLVAWVRVPVLNADQDTVLYLCYGNGTVTTSQENTAGVWDADYQRVWHLNESVTDESTSGTHADSTANGSNGNQRGNAVLTAGQIGAAQDFDGNDDYIRLNTGEPYPIDARNAYTFETWVYLDTSAGTNDQSGIWGLQNSSAPPLESEFIFGIGDWTPDDRYVKVSTYDGSYHNYFSDSQVALQTWTHISVVYDGVSTIYFYLNGQPDGSAAYTGDPQFISDCVQNIGSLSGAYSSFINGKIDELRISDVNRSLNWIKTSYNNHKWPNKADWPTEGFITVTDAVGTDFSDFPVLVSIQDDPQLKTTANGGQVTDAEGDDIIFTSDAAGTLQLAHEVESYDAASGTLVAWVKLPLLYIDQDTDFYLYYGNSAISTSQENAAGVWDADYTSVWHLAEDVTDEETTATHVDSTANNNDGSQGGNATWTAGQVGAAQDFDGSDDYIGLGTGPPYPSDGTAAFTFEAWVYLDTAPPGGDHYSIWSMRDADLDAEFSYNVGEHIASDNTQIKVAGYDDGWNPDVFSESQISTGTWVHIAAVYDGSSAVFHYVNGIPDGYGLYTVPATDTDMIQTIGSVMDGNAYLFDGKIDELRISDTNRKAAWIQTHYNNQRWPNKTEHPSEGFIWVERGICDEATLVACGSATAGSIDAPGEWYAYKVTLGTPNQLKIYTTGTTDTYGHLYDGNCQEIAQNDTTDDNFFISQTVEAGDYYIQVRHASSSLGTGAYILQVECDDDDHGDELEDATEMDCGTTVDGEIESGGDVDYFKVVFWGTGNLTAYTSGDNKTYGTLLDESGNVLTTDDDSGDGKRFKIVHAVSPGVYYIEVKHDKDDKTLDYTLHLECEYTPVIIASAEYGGTITPSGAVGVSYQSDQTFTITPNAGNTIRDVWVSDVGWIGPVTSYEFKNVEADHKIVAVFNADFENCVDIPDIPLDAWYRSAPANVMFVLDDSGSMDWEFMTAGGEGTFEDYYRYVFDDPGDHVYGRVLPDDKRMRWKSQWAGHNQLYYDPAVDYQPWPNHVANDTALTVAAADPDTPRSHPMHDSPTLDLTGTYHQFTSDTGAVIVDEGDSGFAKTPTGSGDQTLLSTGFEEGSPAWKDNWNNPAWNRANDQDKSGEWSVKGNATYEGFLTSKDLDASDLGKDDSITVEFWFRKLEIEDYEFVLSFWDGKKWNDQIDLEHGYWDNRWYKYTQTITDKKYFNSDFKIRFYHNNTWYTEMVWLDDIVVTKSSSGTGGWEEATGSDEAHNGDYLWTGADGDYTATWTPEHAERGPV